MDIHPRPWRSVDGVYALRHAKALLDQVGVIEFQRLLDDL
jgi:hypothetical protein